MCQKLSAIVDGAIVDLFDHEREDYDGALVTIGGYGRGLLNPHSDVDLLFLLSDSFFGKAGSPPEMLLTRLWDLGMKVGHSSRTITDAVNMGRSDLISKTSMMESRLLAGSKDLYDAFRKKYAREVTRHKPDIFIQSKIREKHSRHMAYGKVLHLTEPNVKESKGGLRDFQSAMWMIMSKIDVDTVADLAAMGIINAETAGPVTEAYSYLLRLRNSLHWAANGPTDTLTHGLQKTIAKGENIDGTGNDAAAELMRRYYNAAQVIDRFSGEVSSYAETYKKRRWIRRLRIDKDGLYTDGARLFGKSFPPDKYENEPALLYRIAQRLSGEQLTASPNLSKGLSTICEHAPAGWFRGKVAGELLMDILRLSHSAIVLREFHKSGLLEKIIPEISNITNLSQFDMFHRYTVDEHTITTIENIEGITVDAPVCAELRNICRAQADLELVKLGLLLHDMGKRAEDRHLDIGDEHVEPILTRLGLASLIPKVSFLVSKHVLMSETAQRLNIAMLETIRDFCEKVGNIRQLMHLYILTYGDISAVGPGVWTGWKDNLLFDLYESAEKFFIEGESLFLSDTQQLEALVQETVTRSGIPGNENRIREFMSKAPDQYIRTIDPDFVIVHMDLLERSKEKRIALSFTLNPGDETGVFNLASSGKIGFFSTICGALTARNVNIVEAYINTFSDSLAIDTLVVQGPNLGLYNDHAYLAQFETLLCDLLDGTQDVLELLGNRMRYMQNEKRKVNPDQEPQVLIMNHLSHSSSVLEIWAPDRTGLLYDITHTIARQGLDILSAKISTEGRTAINVFYVTDESGKKIEDEAMQANISDNILSVIRS